jgi:hypothetical protein
MAEHHGRIEFQDLDPSLAFEAPELADIVAYWRGKASGTALPTRAQIDPIELPRHLGHLLLVDVLREPLRLKYRLIGSAITAVAGRDATGCFLDELYDPETYRSVAASFFWVIEHQRPVRVSGTMQHVDRAWLRFEAVDIPLGGPDGVHMILSRHVFKR